MLFISIGIAIAVVAAILLIAIPLFFRVVVSTNEVHIVQSARKTLSYGKNKAGHRTEGF